ncbi:unnamed protein product [Fusarium graminearum]|nr:hypothetical protein FG05_30530 [Fusarium graminearum]CAF3457783.1 unnamed protein product [Fusarium graminearum]CAG1960352.1 unnamed protein product [Fusarium graminearum]VTO85176.1 unnamed protein product [Fusarium graminearum]
MSDNSQGISFRTEHMNHLTDGNVIWHEMSTVPGNISAIKRLVMSNDRNFIDDDDVATILDMPKELLDRLNAFLWKYPHDLIALNDALRAVLVHDRIMKAADREAETWAYGVVDGRPGLKHAVPNVALATFVIYWPHYMRYHEEKSMSRHIHPFRFIHTHYVRDTFKYGMKMTIYPTHLNTGRISELVANLRSLSPDVPANHFIPVLPHSMPGTQLIWPKGTRTAQKGSAGLHALLLLNDIKLCGLPSYHHRDDWLQLISMPGCFANAVIRSVMSSHTYAPTIPTPMFWAPDMRGTLVSISGTHQFVGPFFKDIDPSMLPERFHHIPGSIAEALQEFCDYDISDEAFRRQTRERQCMRLNLARALNTPIENLRIDEKSGLITWDGMQDEVVMAVENNAIPSVFRQRSVPAPAPTRVTTPPPDNEPVSVDSTERLEPKRSSRLSTEHRDEMRQLLKELPIRSQPRNHIILILSGLAPPTHADLSRALEPLTACFDKAERLKGHFDGTVPVSDDEQRIDVLAAVPGIIAQICGAVPVEDTSLYICSAAKWAKSNAAERFPDDLKSLASQATFLAGIGPSVDAWAMFGSVYMPFSESNGYSAQRDLLGIIQGEIDSNAADRT